MLEENNTRHPTWVVAETLLGELLAVIHRDGGHYQAEHGTPKAVEDAKKIIYKMRMRTEG
jgi:hypothetical protein